MARINFGSFVQNIIGKLAGTVFQNSYGGPQVRSKVVPRNPQSRFQQSARSNFGYINSLWRSLSNIERNTFITAAPSGSSGFNLFSRSNINLSLVNAAPITTFVSSAPPPMMQPELTTYSIGEISIQVTSSVTTVPSGHSLVILVTFEQQNSIYFFAPSAYSPVIVFPASTDLASPVNIASEWISRFGAMRPNMRLCLYSALINTTNGLRTNSLSTCQNTTDMLPYYIYIANLTQTDDGAPVAVEASFNTIPPLSWEYGGVGTYQALSDFPLPYNKTFCCSVCNGQSFIGFVAMWRASDTQIALLTYDSTGTPSDNILSNYGIQIIVSY